MTEAPQPIAIEDQAIAVELAFLGARDSVERIYDKLEKNPRAWPVEDLKMREGRLPALKAATETLKKMARAV